MASLRTRLLVSVLLLAAAGLIALAAVIYAEQRSFLEGRVDQHIKRAAPALSSVLDREGLRPAGSGGRGAPMARAGAPPSLRLARARDRPTSAEGPGPTCPRAPTASAA